MELEQPGRDVPDVHLRKCLDRLSAYRRDTILLTVVSVPRQGNLHVSYVCCAGTDDVALT